MRLELVETQRYAVLSQRADERKRRRAAKQLIKDL